MKKKVILAILDGWGIAQDPTRSAIDLADTPFVDGLYEAYSNATLVTYGAEVGLPEGQMGNSEVGHLNIGAGRIVFQELARINNEISDGVFSKNPNLIEALRNAEKGNQRVHLMGLVSDGGVHSHINHLKALCESTLAYDLKDVFIHAFMDGRDCDPNSGIDHLKNLNSFIEDKQNISLSSVIGRYYAMDRDQRWERIKKAYDLMVNGTADVESDDIIKTLQSCYQDEITDEFLPPISLNSNGLIREGDAVLFFNFRTDRPRQITTALTQENFEDFGMHKLELDFSTMTQYDESYKNINVLYRKDNLEMTLGEVLQNAKKTQVRIAETEKYPHVTFFFNGGREEPFEGEKRIMVSSPKVDTYDLAPEMGAIEITDKIIQELEENEPDFICLNYANADMVGHTGVLDAAIEACRTVDEQLSRLYEAAKAKYEIIVIADHGNSDILMNEDGSAHTAHTTNPVPIFLLTDSKELSIQEGKLADIAVSILNIMGIHVPDEMDGTNLVSYN